MEVSQEEKFDGQVVMRAEGLLHESEVVYYHHGVHLMNPANALNRAQEVHNVERMDIPQDLVYPNLTKQLAELREELGDQIFDAILEGRLKVSMLLNSPGGYFGTLEHRKGIVKMLKQREDAKGQIDAYLKYAAGPGAELYLESDNRIITPQSILCPIFYTTKNAEFNEERNDDLVFKMTSQVSIEAANELNDKIQEAIEELPNVDSMVFEAIDMMRFGLASKIVSSRQELREEFLKRTGITLLPDALSSPFEKKVKTFFE